MKMAFPLTDIEVGVKILKDGAQPPEFKRKGDAGADLRSVEYLRLSPGEFQEVPTGIAIEIPFGYFGLIKPRSGLALRFGIHTLAGVVDSNYRGEIKVILVNLGKKPFDIKKGDRIAQLLIIPIMNVSYVTKHELSDTIRGEDGFGSSGIE